MDVETVAMHSVKICFSVNVLLGLFSSYVFLLVATEACMSDCLMCSHLGLHQKLTVLRQRNR